MQGGLAVDHQVDPDRGPIGTYALAWDPARGAFASPAGDPNGWILRHSDALPERIPGRDGYPRTEDYQPAWPEGWHLTRSGSGIAGTVSEFKAGASPQGQYGQVGPLGRLPCLVR